jgi:crotonobetainyl-CoA:carnitine CoA-transferase CaiB-like acyl-CoA transferase
VPTPSPAPPVGEHNDELRAFATAAGAWRDAGTEQPKPLKHALEGVRVLDFASFFASPYGAKILSDLGADVIMVEAPGGDQMRPLPNPFEASQRGKRNIVIDLKSADGRAVAHDLVRTADIVLHNQRPGKAEKLTIDFATLSKINPKLVYCYLPGYGSSGPKSHLKAFAPLISGFTGLLYEGAGAGNPPVRSVEGNEDYYNGLLGAVAMLTGLEHRARTGEGLYIESPQLHSSLFVTSHHFLGPQRQSLTARQLDHEQMGWGPLYRLYPTADDWICLACVGDACFRRLASALKLPAELIAKCETDIERRGVADDLAIEVGRRLAGMTSVAARDLLRANDVPCEIPATEPMVPSLFWQDWALESGRVFEHPESMHGHIREIGIYTRLSDTAAQRKGPAPRLGQHTREILGEMGYSPERVTDLLTRGVVHGENVAR